MKRWILQGSLVSLAFSGLAFGQGQSKEEWIKQEAEREFRDTTMSRLKSLEEKFKDPKTGKDKDAWWDMIKLFGDFRYRHEIIDTENTKERNRDRLRVRVGLSAKVNDEVDFMFRMASGESADPISTNQTETGAFGKKSIFIDSAFVDYHPMSNFHVLAGKMENPFYIPSRADLIWDFDLTPEGGAIKWDTIMDQTRIFANVGGFWLRENSSPQADSYMVGGQLGWQFELNPDSKFTLGVSHFEYVNENSQLVFSDYQTAGTNGFGNTTTGASPNLRYTKEYRINELFGDFSFMMGDMPVLVVADYAQNAGVSTQNKAYLAGFEVGKVKDPGSWAFRYNYRKLQRDAVIGAFTDSDSGGGGTNHKGHKFQVEYQLAKRWSAAVSYFRDKNSITSADELEYNRVMIDFQFKF